MLSYLALYRGRTLEDAQLIAVSANPSIVKALATRLLREHTPETDDVIGALDDGRRHALKLITNEMQRADSEDDSNLNQASAHGRPSTLLPEENSTAAIVTQAFARGRSKDIATHK